MQIFIVFFGAVILVIGVKLIYDARLIVNKYFSVSQKNTAVNVLKVVGTICAIIGVYLVAKNWI